MGVISILTPSKWRRVWFKKKGFWSDKNPFALECITPVFSTTYISDGGHPAVM